MKARYERFCMCRKYTGEEAYAYDSKRKKIDCFSFVHYFRYPPPLHSFFTQSSLVSLSIIHSSHFLISFVETIFSSHVCLFLSSPFSIWSSSARPTFRELYSWKLLHVFRLKVLPYDSAMGARYKGFCMCRKHTGEEAYDSKEKNGLFFLCPLFSLSYPPPFHSFFTQSTVLNP